MVAVALKVLSRRFPYDKHFSKPLEVLDIPFPPSKAQKSAS